MQSRPQRTRWLASALIPLRGLPTTSTLRKVRLRIQHVWSALARVISVDLVNALRLGKAVWTLAHISSPSLGLDTDDQWCLIYGSFPMYGAAYPQALKRGVAPIK